MKIHFAVAIAVLSSSIAHAQSEVGADPHPERIEQLRQSAHGMPEVRLGLTIAGEGTPTKKSEVVIAVMGRPTEISIIETHSYRENCGFEANGKMLITPGHLNTGLTVTATPVMETSEGTLIQIDLNSLRIVSMGNAEINGCEIDLPRTSGQSYNTMVILRKGQRSDLPALSGHEDRFSIERF